MERWNAHVLADYCSTEYIDSEKIEIPERWIIGGIYKNNSEMVYFAFANNIRLL